jgi:superfamily II DNA or RNA helicase
MEKIPEDVRTALKATLQFQNPEFQERRRRGRSVYGVEKSIRCFKEDSTGFSIPRGATRQMITILQKFNLPYRLEDHRRTLQEVNLRFQGELRDYQKAAVEDVLRRDFGVLEAPTGSGKTVMSLAIIAARRQPTLIAVPSLELLEQWIDRSSSFLEIPVSEVGVIGGGKFKPGEAITVATIQSLYGRAKEIAPFVGNIVLDECHHVPSRTFTDVVGSFDSKFMLGLSATPWRRDKLDKLIYFYLGDHVHRVESASLRENGSILHAEVIFRETAFRTKFHPSEEYGKMISELIDDPTRNELIVQDVATEAAKGIGACLVLADRKTHCHTLAGLLRQRGVECEVLTGEVSKPERKRIVKSIDDGSAKVIIATGQLIGEGFDATGLSVLFLASPIRFGGRLLQYVGRVIRPAPGKHRAVIFDYVDAHVGVLKHSAKERRKIYDAA